MDENNVNCISTACREELGKFTFETTNTHLTDENVEISSVVYGCSTLSDLKIETAERKGIITGKLTTKILYKDAEDMTISVLGTTLFSESFDAPSILANTKILAHNISIDADISVEGKEFVVKNTVSLELSAYIKQVICAVTNTTNDLISKTDTVPTLQLTSCISGGFACECELTIAKSITKILFTDVCFAPADFLALEGYVSVAGTLTVGVLYEIDKDGICLMRYHSDSCTVKGEIESKDVDLDTILDLSAMLDCTKNVINTSIADNSTTISLESYVDICGYGLKTVNQAVVCDCYSTKCQTEHTYTERNVHNIDRLSMMRSEFIGECSCSNADEIIGVLGTSVSVTKSQLVTDRWIVEGVFEGSIIYVDDQGGTLTSKFSTPFQIERHEDISISANSILPNICASNLRTRIKRSDLITIEYTLSLSGTVYTKEHRTFLSEVKVGEPIDYGSSAYQIFIAQAGEDMWSICKRLNIETQTLLDMNHDLPNPFVGGERIFITR